MQVSAMILAAGLGTRLYPLTKDKPKALVEVNGKTLLEHSILKIIDAGIHDIVINIHHFGEQIIHFINEHRFDANIHISDERASLLDTAGGFKFAAPHFTNADHILLYNVDILSSINLSIMLEEHVKTDALATLAVRDRETQRYFLFDKQTMQLNGWINKKTGERIEVEKKTNSEVTELAFSGIHIVKKEILQFIPEVQKQSFTPLYLELAKKHPIYGYQHQTDSWMDVGKYDEWVNLHT